MPKTKEDKSTRTSEYKSIKADAENEIMSRSWLKALVVQIFGMQRNIVYNPDHIHALLDAAKEDFRSLPTLMELEAPTFVCGDIHGQLTDLKRIFIICGFPRKKRILFLGDYVDRGQHSIEVVLLLLAFRQLYPTNVYLLRGNHELAHINRTYGFLEEVRARWPKEEGDVMYNHFNEVFSYLPLSALISKQILCMHGGLSPRLTSLKDLQSIERPIIMPKALAQDILWADPECGVTGFKKNELRACSFNFGEEDVKEKCKALGVTLIIRAHQVKEKGYALFANKTVITVFSASRYQEDLWNYGGIVNISKNLEVSFTLLKPSEYQEVTKKKEDVTADFSDRVSSRKT